MPTLADLFVTNLTSNLSEAERERLNAGVIELSRRFFTFAELFGSALHRTAITIANGHERQALLQLYRVRRSWKTADLVKIRTYRINGPATKLVAKLERNTRLGPGATRAFEPMKSCWSRAARKIWFLHDPETPPLERLRALKKSHLRDQFVEATYRGEYLRLRALGVRAAADQAVEAVGKAFIMSDHNVRRVCRLTRRDAAAGFKMSDPIEVRDFEIWKATGKFPDSCAP